MDYLDDKRIEVLMSRYLSENIYNYAIMLDGDWGSGKTYFVQEVLIPKLKESIPNRRAIYVSLYGLKATEEITNSIFTSIVEHRMGNGKKMLPILNGAVKIIAEVLGDKFGSDTISGADTNMLSPFLTYNDYYFIFDDLERCSMPINEVLGYINHFLEQNNAKVLIVANEKEIGSVELPENNLFKYLIAAQDSIEWPEKEKTDPFGNIQKNRKTIQTNPNLDEVKWRSGLLVNENTLYLQVKEKLIGQTIFYRPALQNVVPVIFRNCFNEIKVDLNFQEKSINLICLIMESGNYFNLRTLQFALSFFSKICKDFPCGKSCLDPYKEMLSQILEAILKVSIAYKNGDKKYEWAENSEYGIINLKETWSYYNYFHSFKFVHKYVYCGSYNFEHIQTVLNEYLEYLIAEKTAQDDPTNILNYYWEMEDAEIEYNLNKLLENLESGKYKGNLYRWILSLLFKLKGIGFEAILVEKYVNIMEENVVAGMSIYTMQEPIITKNDTFIDDYILCIKKLEDLEHTSHKEIKEDSLNAIFDIDKGWGQAFSDHYGENKQTLMTENGFFKHIDIDKCFKAIDRASVKDLSDFRRSVAAIYNFSNIGDFYSDDADNIDKLNTMLDKDYEKKMKQFNIKLLRKDFESILIGLRKSAD